MMRPALLAVLAAAACAVARRLARLRACRQQRQQQELLLVPLGDHHQAVTAVLLPHNAAACDRALRRQLQQLASTSGAAAGRVVGLDVEWQPESSSGQQHPVALVQLAFPATCLLFHVIHMRHLPPALRQLLADPAVVKVGVGLANDVARLQQHHGCVTRGAVDLGPVFAAVTAAASPTTPPPHPHGTGLAALAAAVLGVQVDKSQQRSNWAAARLTPDQSRYAALDAWLPRRMAEALFEMKRRAAAAAARASPAGAQEEGGRGAAAAAAAAGRRGLLQRQEGLRGPCPPLDWAAWLATFALPAPAPAQPAPDAPRQQPPGAARASARGSPAGSGRAGAAADAAALTAAPLGVPGHTAAAGAAGEQGPRCSSGGGGRGGRGGGAPRQLKPASLPTRKTAQYENCRLLAPDGTVLCTCSAKKARWYVDRGLGQLEASEPLTVRLSFEPRGRGHSDDAYYLSDKDNRCCGCGRGEDYLRHSIVPHCYRQHFPEHMKSHLSHDVVLLCTSCHQLCNAHDTRRMQELGQQYGAPLEHEAHRFQTDPALSAAKSAGKALQARAASLPPGRRRELEQVLVRHFGLDGAAQLTAQHVAQAAALEPRRPRVEWTSHAKAVVAAVMAAAAPTAPAAGADAAGPAAAATAAAAAAEAASSGTSSSTSSSSSSNNNSSSSSSSSSSAVPDPAAAALEGFVRGWRQHFLAVVQPRHLPAFWSVDARVSNSSAPGAS